MSGITPKEVAALCGVKVASLSSLVKSRELPATKAGTSRTSPWRFERASVEAWLKTHQTHPKASVSHKRGAGAGRRGNTATGGPGTRVPPAAGGILSPSGDAALGLRQLLLAWVRAAVGDEFQEELPGLHELRQDAVDRLDVLLGSLPGDVGKQWPDVRAFLLTRVNHASAAPGECAGCAQKQGELEQSAKTIAELRMQIAMFEEARRPALAFGSLHTPVVASQLDGDGCIRLVITSH